HPQAANNLKSITIPNWKIQTIDLSAMIIAKPIYGSRMLSLNIADLVSWQ
ncbi:unnamed protein product, partial [marine sediment metagenome]